VPAPHGRAALRAADSRGRLSHMGVAQQGKPGFLALLGMTIELVGRLVKGAIFSEAVDCTARIN